jgi:TatD DNase family protein
MNLIDTHCHLNFHSFDSDFLEVAQKSYQEGVRKIMIVGSDPKTSSEAIERARLINKTSADSAYVAVGIHAVHTDRDDFDVIEKLSKEKEVMAVGETGIDFFHDKERKTEQEQMI